MTCKHLIALTLLFLGCATQHLTPADPLVVAVRAQNGWCSGVWTGPNEVLTAAHCVNTSEAHFAASGKSGDGVALPDDFQDLATIASPFTGPAYASTRLPVAGETVEIREWHGRIQHTRIVSLDFTWRTAKISYTPSHGQSGSPVFGADGKVVCILSGSNTLGSGGECQLLNRTN